MAAKIEFGITVRRVDGVAHRSPNGVQISVIICAIHMVGLRFRSAYGAV